ncbi:MAG: retinal pigment epithelial membrane protein-domain-containing protein, partial [Monoraphidium minutum]
MLGSPRPVGSRQGRAPREVTHQWIVRTRRVARSAPQQSVQTSPPPAAESVSGITRVPLAPLLQHPPSREGRNVVTTEMLLDVKRLLGSLYEEYDYAFDPAWIEGKIPADLEGTYFRNGPGLQVTSGRYTRHVFDGDGMVCAFALRGGRAWFRNRFVRTRGFVDEQAAGRPLYRSAFTKGSADGSPFFNPFELDLKNVANTGVLHWAGRLLALFENGLPYEMDPRTLGTRGETRLGGAVTTKALGAHYRMLRDAATGDRRWVTFGVEAGPSFKVVFYEFDEAGALLHKQEYSLPGTMITILHDFTVTEHYYVLVEGPINFDLGKFLGSYLFSKCSVAACLVFDETRKTRVHLIPRGAGAGGAAA